MTVRKQLKAIEVDYGANASIPMNGDASPLVFLASSFEDVERVYQDLKSKDAQRAFFDSGLTRIDRSLPSSWARLYWFIELCRREKWFWTEKGYESFEAFWASKGQFAFAEIAKLEAMFQFARTACPKLFALSRHDAEELWKWMQKRSTKSSVTASVTTT